MDKTDDGIEICFKFEHPLNDELPIIVIDEEITISVRFENWLKLQFSSFVDVVEIINLVNFDSL